MGAVDGAERLAECDPLPVRQGTVEAALSVEEWVERPVEAVALGAQRAVCGGHGGHRGVDALVLMKKGAEGESGRRIDGALLQLQEIPRLVIRNDAKGGGCGACARRKKFDLGNAEPVGLREVLGDGLVRDV
ncbi:hypothetical protein A3K87_10320 [Variovorax paradoxus]|uniref:Uncharacterized protein n=1 Tax=Variovorax paradoxus TaxID=34073 RepID=A0AA91DRG0_VARPD|nr:hypothetical protein A3K87_10320 [Variovorax paradoxus]